MTLTDKEFRIFLHSLLCKKGNVTQTEFRLFMGYFKRLPCEERLNILEDHIEHSRTVANLIGSTFVFSNTNEGHRYWQKIQDRNTNAVGTERMHHLWKFFSKHCKWDFSLFLLYSTRNIEGGAINWRGIKTHMKFSRFYEVINMSFNWSKTIEGYKFWNDVANGIIKDVPNYISSQRNVKKQLSNCWEENL